MNMLGVVFLQLVICFAGVVTQSHTNFEVTRIENCGNNKGPIKLNYINVTRKGGTQYLNYDFLMMVPLDEKIGASSFIEYEVNEKTFIPLFTIREKYACKAAHQYLGEFWYDIERAAQIMPRVCPIPARHYHAHNLMINFKKMTLQTFPFGKIRFTVKLIDNTNSDNILACLLMQVKNVLQ